MTQVILGKSRVREICMPGSVRAKAEWLSYSTKATMSLHVTLDLTIARHEAYSLYHNNARLSDFATPPTIFNLSPSWPWPA